jgi:hypothetical protein
MTAMDSTSQPPEADEPSQPLEQPLVDANGLPVYADDGTDLTVIRWFLQKSPAERLKWLEAHMGVVAKMRRDT